LKELKLPLKPRAVLTPREVRLIYCRYWNSQITQRRLGAEFGVSHSTIKDIVLDRTWKKVSRDCTPSPQIKETTKCN
jgi:DNA-directed RNA polymerase sigma subunit (sigma70/sigma32)